MLDELIETKERTKRGQGRMRYLSDEMPSATTVSNSPSIHDDPLEMTCMTHGDERRGGGMAA